MTCIYYIQTELVIEHKGRNGIHNTTYTNRRVKKYLLPDNGVHNTVERMIFENSFITVLFTCRDGWVNQTHKEAYEEHCKDIQNITKIYIRSVGFS
jgi:hypothetical protein